MDTHDSLCNNPPVSTLELEKLIERANREPGVAEVARVYGAAREATKYYPQFVQAPRVVSSATTNVQR